MRRGLQLGVCFAAAAFHVSTASAQEAAVAPPPARAGSEETEIIVTAQKRATNLQDTPLAISAVTGEDLEERQVRDIESLAPTLPNVNFGRNLGIARIAIRGLGLDATVAGQEGRVAFHTDGVYVSRPAAQLGTFFDINRVEVIRGPQGTLYGRNATAGAVNVITNDPGKEFGGYARLTIGNYGTFVEEAALSGPASTTIGARFALVRTDRQGFGKNFTTGRDIDDEHSFGSRAKIRFEASPALTLTLVGDYYTRDDAAFVYHYIRPGNPAVTPFGPALGGRRASDPRDTYANVRQVNHRRFAGIAGTALLDLGFGDLTSITAYRDGRYFLQSDSDDTQVQVAQILTTERSDQVSEELRLAGSSGALDWIVGGYYFVEKIFGETRFSPIRSPVPPLRGAAVFGLNFDGHLKTDAYAAFGQLDYRIIDGLTLTGGLRYSHEKKAIDQRGAVELTRRFNPTQQPNYSQFQDDSVTFSDFTPKLGVQYQAGRDLLLYASYSEGFKSGGYNLSGFGPPVRPERLTDYEAGLKSQLFDRALTLNLAAFYYDYTDLHVQVIRGSTAVLENAAAARVKGVEGEVTVVPFEGLQLSANAAYLKSHFTSYSTPDPARPSLGVLDLSGNQLPQAPSWTANAAAQYSFPIGQGEAMLRGELIYSDRIYFTPFNRREVSQPAYTKGNLIARYESRSGLSIAGFVRNVGDKRTISSALVSGGFSGFPIMGAYDAPRTYGATLGYTF